MVTFCSATDDFFEEFHHQMWHLSVLTLFLKLISRPSLLTPKSKPLLKSLEYYFLKLDTYKCL